MKKYLSLLLLTALFVGCQQKVKEEPKKEVKRSLAKIEFPDGTDFDFGSFYEKEAKTHGFAVYNAGKEPLVIDSIYTTCGCTKAQKPVKPIMPGETDTIRIFYNGDGFPEGNFVKHVYVFSNVDSIVDLTFRGAYFNPNPEY